MKDAWDAEEALKAVGLGHRLHNFPAQLSGGEQQRVSIARAIAKKPKILQEMSRDYGATVIIVTHNTALAPLANRVIHMHDARVKSIVLNESPQAIEELEY